jgi:hypothetical protein
MPASASAPRSRPGRGAIALTVGGHILRTSGTLAAAGLSLNPGGDAGAAGAPLRFAPTGSTLALSTGGSVFLDILGPQTTTLLGSAGGSVTIGGGGPLLIGQGATGLTVGAALDLRSGAIAQASGTALVVGGQAVFDPGGSSLLLPSALNDFGGAVSIGNAASASLADTDDLTLGPVTVSGTFAAFAGGSIGQTGVLDTGPMALSAGSDIFLAGFANRTPVLAATAGGTLAFDHAGSLAIGQVSPAGGLATVSGLQASLAGLRAAGTLTQTRSVAAGQLAFRTGGAATLALSANSFGTLAASAGGPLELAGTGGFAVGTVPAAGGLAGLSGARSVGAMTLTAFGFGAAIATGSGTGLGPAGALRIRAEDMSLLGSIAANGRSVTLEPLTPGRTIGIGGAGAAGDFRLDGGELGGIAAAGLQIGNPEAGQITLGRIDAGDVDGFGTLQLVTFAGIDFNGPLNGNLNFTLAPGPGSDGNIAFRSSVGDQAPLASIVFAAGNDVSIAEVFRAREIVVGAIGGTVQNRNLTPGSDRPTGIAVDGLSIVGANPLAAQFFGTVGGIGGEQAALIATADPRNNEYQINGCVIGDLTSCIDFGVDVPAQAQPRPVEPPALPARPARPPGRRGHPVLQHRERGAVVIRASVAAALLAPAALALAALALAGCRADPHPAIVPPDRAEEPTVPLGPNLVDESCRGRAESGVRRRVGRPIPPPFPAPRPRGSRRPRRGSPRSPGRSRRPAAPRRCARTPPDRDSRSAPARR